MSNEADQGNETAELFLAAALAGRKRMHLNPCGHCYYCDETVQRGVLFCSPDCNADWELEQKIKRISGQQ